MKKVTQITVNKLIHSALDCFHVHLVLRDCVDDDAITGSSIALHC